LTKGPSERSIVERAGEARSKFLRIGPIMSGPDSMHPAQSRHEATRARGRGRWVAVVFIWAFCGENNSKAGLGIPSCRRLLETNEATPGHRQSTGRSAGEAIGEIKTSGSHAVQVSFGCHSSASLSIRPPCIDADAVCTKLASTGLSPAIPSGSYFTQCNHLRLSPFELLTFL
jgi:hypothetical protein